MEFSKMNVLIACEESQRVCIEFRRLGHRAFSCDLTPCSGGKPQWHIKDDVLKVINGDCTFKTEDKKEHKQVGEWDLIIAHPPCTYLTNAASRFHSLKKTPIENINKRTKYRIEAAEFFMNIINTKCKRIAVENPVGIMSTVYRQPDQIISPYQFAESVDDKENYVTKRTCLWLKGLVPLKTNDLPKPDNAKLFGIGKRGQAYCWNEKVSTKDRAKTRSKTFTGVAKAMAKMWGEIAKRAEDEQTTA